MILQGTLRDINEARGQRQLNYFKMKSTFHARIEVFGWLAAVRRVCFDHEQRNDALGRSSLTFCFTVSDTDQ